MSAKMMSNGNRASFDTDGTKVVTIRSGREPELSYVEGCG